MNIRPYYHNLILTFAPSNFAAKIFNLANKAKGRNGRRPPAFSRLQEAFRALGTPMGNCLTARFLQKPLSEQPLKGWSFDQSTAKRKHRNGVADWLKTNSLKSVSLKFLKQSVYWYPNKQGKYSNKFEKIHKLQKTDSRRSGFFVLVSLKMIRLLRFGRSGIALRSRKKRLVFFWLYLMSFTPSKKKILLTLYVFRHSAISLQNTEFFIRFSI